MLDNYQRVEAVIAAFARARSSSSPTTTTARTRATCSSRLSLCTPEKMAFIIRHTSGIVCAPLSAEEAKRLHLDPMVAANDAPLGTAFTVSVDVRHGLTTGISAEERTNTVRALANGNSGAADFVRPGHVFPLVAKDGGVLMRSGHTEACVDLCRLAGLPPVGVLAELMNDDGTVMRGPAVIGFAETHKLKQISIADLIAYRQARDKLVERIGEFPVQSKIGTLAGLCLCHAVRRHPAHGIRVRPDRRRQEHAGAPASGRHHPRRVRWRQYDPLRRCSASSRRAAASSCSCATARPACRRTPSRSRARPVRKSRARGNGARSGSAPRSSRISGITSIRLLTSAKLTYVGLAGFGIEIASTEMIDDGRPD